MPLKDNMNSFIKVAYCLSVITGVLMKQKV